MSTYGEYASIRGSGQWEDVAFVAQPVVLRDRKEDVQSEAEAAKFAVNQIGMDPSDRRYEPGAMVDLITDWALDIGTLSKEIFAQADAFDSSSETVFFLIRIISSPLWDQLLSHEQSHVMNYAVQLYDELSFREASLVQAAFPLVKVVLTGHRNRERVDAESDVSEEEYYDYHLPDLGRMTGFYERVHCVVEHTLQAFNGLYKTVAFGAVTLLQSVKVITVGNIKSLIWGIESDVRKVDDESLFFEADRINEVIRNWGKDWGAKPHAWIDWCFGVHEETAPHHSAWSNLETIYRSGQGPAYVGMNRASSMGEEAWYD